MCGWGERGISGFFRFLVFFGGSKLKSWQRQSPLIHEQSLYRLPQGTKLERKFNQLTCTSGGSKCLECQAVLPGSNQESYLVLSPFRGLPLPLQPLPPPPLPHLPMSRSRNLLAIPSFIAISSSTTLTHSVLKKKS